MQKKQLRAKKLDASKCPDFILQIENFIFKIMHRVNLFCLSYRQNTTETKREGGGGEPCLNFSFGWAQFLMLCPITEFR